MESKILVKSPKQRNKAQKKVDYKYYDAITMRRNYQEKLWHEIIRRNYDAKLSASIYYVVENVEIIGILAYPKIFCDILQYFLNVDADIIRHGDGEVKTSFIFPSDMDNTFLL